MKCVWCNNNAMMELKEHENWILTDFNHYVATHFLTLGDPYFKNPHVKVFSQWVDMFLYNRNERLLKQFAYISWYILQEVWCKSSFLWGSGTAIVASVLLFNGKVVVLQPLGYFIKPHSAHRKIWAQESWFRAYASKGPGVYAELVPRTWLRYWISVKVHYLS